MNETLVKYLAGLLDADGALSFNLHHKNGGDYMSLRMVLVAAESIDRDGRFVKSLPSITGFGSVVSSQYNAQWSVRNDWVVTARNEIEMLLPRVIKHMVIKAKHWQFMLDTWRERRGKNVIPEDWAFLKAASKESRKNTGPLKAKSHPTWAWVAGYIDGDGHFRNRYYANKKHHRIGVQVTAHVNDKCGLELLQKAFGGAIRHRTPSICDWSRGMGYSQASFATRFLGKLVNHSKLKKHAIEQIIHIHKQRLSVSTPAGDAIV